MNKGKLFSHLEAFRRGLQELGISEPEIVVLLDPRSLTQVVMNCTGPQQELVAQDKGVRLRELRAEGTLGGNAIFQARR